MLTKKFGLLLVIAVLLISSFGFTGSAHAWSSCPSYVTVQWGDTLSGIALLCGTTVHAIRAANPGLGWWVYAGQTLYIPAGYTPPAPQPSHGGTYIVQWGDTLGKIAGKTGTSVTALLAVNPQIANPSLIYAGQMIYLPVGAGTPPTNPPTQPPSADSFKLVKITYSGGLFIRSAPGGDILSSAVLDTYWYYNTSSIRRMKDGSVWVEVKLGEQINGVWRGWMLVKDHLGKNFTSPAIN